MFDCSIPSYGRHNIFYIWYMALYLWLTTVKKSCPSSLDNIYMYTCQAIYWAYDRNMIRKTEGNLARQVHMDMGTVTGFRVTGTWSRILRETWPGRVIGTWRTVTGFRLTETWRTVTLGLPGPGGCISSPTFVTVRNLGKATLFLLQDKMGLGV